MEEKIKKLSSYILELKEKRNLGFNQLALKSGVNAKTLNEIMYGKAKRVNPIYLIQLAKALGVHYKEFYKILGYLDIGDDIVRDDSRGNLNFSNSTLGDNNFMIGGSVSNSNIKPIFNEKKDTDSENFLDLTKLDKRDTEIIKNLYNSLLKK